MTLQEKMIEYRRIKLMCDAMEAEIKQEVAEKASSAVSEGIDVVYSAGRKTYNYESAGKEYGTPEIIAKHTTPKVDWAKVCKESGVVQVPFTQGSPIVYIRIQKESTPFPEA